MYICRKTSLMKYIGKRKEIIFVNTLLPERLYMFKEDLRTGLSVIWNIGDRAEFFIDNQKITLNKNCIIFITEFHKITKFNFEKLNVIQFNRDFHCVEKHDEDIGCKGLLFFGSSSIPKIILPKNSIQYFNTMWDMLYMEIEEFDTYTLEMLKSLLTRFLILCTRIYKKENFTKENTELGIGIIREFNFLVEKNFKHLTQVKDYARLLNKTPKSLANLFKMYIDKSPIQIINERRLIEAKRLLLYSDQQIKNISDTLQFNDVQAFSNFFKKNTGFSPNEFKTKKQLRQ